MDPIDKNPKPPTFDQLPAAVFLLIEKVTNLENLLMKKEEKDTKTQSGKFLTAKQTAEFLDLALQTVYGLVTRKNIPNFKINKRLYFDKDQLISWIESGRRKTSQEIAIEAKGVKEAK